MNIWRAWKAKHWDTRWEGLSKSYGIPTSGGEHAPPLRAGMRRLRAWVVNKPAEACAMAIAAIGAGAAVIALLR